jgi:hypothetical protein
VIIFLLFLILPPLSTSQTILILLLSYVLNVPYISGSEVKQAIRRRNAGVQTKAPVLLLKVSLRFVLLF